jgi:hypothetical protein
MSDNIMILNLTQHLATEDQVAAGVVDLPEPHRERLLKALTFRWHPRIADVEHGALDIATIVRQIARERRLINFAVMINEMPFFMASLEAALGADGEGEEEDGWRYQAPLVLYAFTKREGGGHACFVPAFVL